MIRRTMKFSLFDWFLFEKYAVLYEKYPSGIFPIKERKCQSSYQKEFKKLNEQQLNILKEKYKGQIK